MTVHRLTNFRAIEERKLVTVATVIEINEMYSRFQRCGYEHSIALYS